MEYSDNYSKTSRHLWQHYRDESPLINAGVIYDSSGNSASFKFKQKIKGKTKNNGTKNVDKIVSLKFK